MGVKSAELHVLNGRERVFSAALMKTRKKKDKTDGLEIFQLQAFLATYNWRNSKHLSL